MQDIINPIERDAIKNELTPDRFLRYVNNGENEIYLVNQHNAPNVLKEIGRLREISFRAAGGGTGLPLDIDENDTCEKCYDQLIAWNPLDEEIIAGYRLIKCSDAGYTKEGSVNLSTAHLFNFSDSFIKDYLPFTIELGRSFVQPKYQPSVDNRRGIFSLDNLWDGLGAVVMINPDVKYLFGKVTMYPHYNAEARDLLIYFMNHYFPDNDKLIVPITSLDYKTDESNFKGTFDGLSYKEGYKVLNSKVRNLGENIPPLINTYMNLSSTMKTFGTAMNYEFGAVEETGILITISDIYESKKHRHLETFARDRHYAMKNK
ncbi:GNAT family N-acetyltransferase [Cyclobacterium marinum]|uniref:Hemolysin A n=1 Tax=Cyclobacterium marinum (strain ATCC 25205 / DSM 745 / LMG 13164 / NCIMB 1802) TaxID=880070 RepID=G0IYL7_CYCMS|nr:GNAT family N-acetyltransferase [Cyclobacterium marinum]AEL26440.1 hemolysin A [Cyclobacterium marinum DSM 745]MBI0399777.1 GNAT family N-acetyltransferase [Cyclobacterium marinum]MBR9777327.1 GNAT family N-acetyltransferase [Cytophagales bacterium]|tara:strand:+ start:34373 stop:35326 length:954 start_codon:yes stop_codon:yes gene_type:complete